MKLITIRFRGEHSGKLHLNPKLWDRLGESDRRHVMQMVRGEVGYRSRRGTAGRNHLLPLVSPLKIGRSEVTAIRAKGLAPNLSKNGEVRLHRGQGYVKNPLHINEEGRISFEDSALGQPEMGAFLEEAEKEFRVALALGPAITDHALGYGAFDRLNFQRQRLGFSLFGQAHPYDLRLSDPVGCG